MDSTVSFEESVAGRLDDLRPAERRVVRFLQANREDALIASAAEIAEKAGTSDATVVRAAKALGFSGLDSLRRALAGELKQSPSPAERLTRTLDAVGGDLAAAFDTTLEIHARSLESLRGSVAAQRFGSAVDLLAGAERVLVFGLGPSGAIAAYFVAQLSRFGIEAATLSNAGLLFADELGRLRKGDVVVMLAYDQVYAELAALLEGIDRLKLRSILLTDTLAETLSGEVDIVLPVARGRAGMLGMHTATLGLIEALLVGLAVSRPKETLASLRALNAARQALAGKPMALPVVEESLKRRGRRR